MKILYIIIVLIAVFMLIGSILHSIYFRSKLNQIKPYGQLIGVDDGKVHIYSMGNGKKTIVLLPGMGIPLPSADFGPLMRKLSENYTVVCVEYFGVGFSSETSKPRTSKNYVEETRTALSKAGFKAPYILMPHSISSVYSEYYASKYPEEIEAIISLDGTSTAYYDKMPSFLRYILPIAKVQQVIGITSIIAHLTGNKKSLFKIGYTKKELNDIALFAGFSINNTLLEQILNSGEFINETMKLPFPKSVSYFKVISKQTYEKPNKQLKITPQEYQIQHLKRVGEHAKYEILEGSHFIYLNNIDKITEITDNFLLKIN
ncbi:alpha/beta fold hydrolase [Clostridium senegalense]|uniref:alpha/beta fold hydrolase n=1 Tax=Clostridium senegalense TaxID=1465809 RepID=UPI00028A2606|nr:alpha/beta hydrolase [Clostridium senegalense]